MSSWTSLNGSGAPLDASAAERLRHLEARVAQLELENSQLNRVMDAAHLVSVIATDTSGIITLFNAGAERMLGYQAAEVVGKQTPLLIHCLAEVEARAAQMSQELGYPIGLFDVLVERARHGISGNSEWTYVCKDHSRLPVEVAVTAVRDAGGAIVGYLGIAKDLTGRKRQEQLLQAAIDAAEAATSAKSEFLATMSHEIRTPMNGIMGMAGLLLASDLNPRQRKRAETLRESAEALLTVLNDVLDFSKMEAGKLSLEHAPFDLRTVAEGVADLMAVRAQEKGLELTCLIETSVTTAVTGDASRLRQMMLNLVGNAVKFTDSGDIRLRLRRAVPSDGEQAAGRQFVRFEVFDTGSGIPLEKHSAMFQRFSQADASTARRHGGTGLGLSIVQGLAEAMGGTVGFESAPGQGSTFWFQVELPAQPESARPPALSLAGKRILLGGHTGAGRELLTELLEFWQCDVIEEPDAGTALNYLASAGARVDAAVLDLRGASGGGRNLESRLYEDIRLDRLPTVLLTPLRLISGAESSQQRKAYTGRVSKPVKQGELGAALATAFALTQPAPTPAKQPRVAPLEGAGLRILLVEDNPVNQAVALGLLEGWGYTVDTADDAAEVWPLLRTHRYAAVLMDCHLPDVDGYSLTRLIRQSSGDVDAGVPVIAMTANAMAGDREKCLAAGMDDYVPKPVRSQELAAALRHWTRQRSVAALPADQPPTTPPTITQPTSPDMSHPTLALDPGFDAEDFLDRMMGSEDLARRIVEVFVNDTPNQLKALAEALRQADSRNARLIAHSIKGSAANVGGQGLSNVAAQMEKLGEAGDLVAVQQMLPALAANYDALLPLLQEFSAH
ncbi:MAG: ATP-binding protein [Acidobacteria bacterium]|nr:ATP-binding protein [Acidobacteriota bacterium]